MSNHKKSFNVNEYKNETELSNESWQIKNLGHHPQVEFEIVIKLFQITQKQNAVYYV